jgi:hypothetical protein
VRLVGEPIDERFAQSSIGDHLRPLGERQVGGDDDRRSLRPVGDHLEHQFARGLGQRHITEFVDTDQVELFPSTECAAELVGVRGLGQFVDRPRRRLHQFNASSFRQP